MLKGLLKPWERELRTLYLAGVSWFWITPGGDHQYTSLVLSEEVFHDVRTRDNSYGFTFIHDG